MSIINEIAQNKLQLNLATVTKAGNRLCLLLMPCGDGDRSFPIRDFLRTQFPVHLCFGIIDNKSQGQSFSAALGPDPC